MPFSLAEAAYTLSIHLMETPVAPPDPALDALADTRGPLRRMARLAAVGLVVWLGLLGWFAFWLANYDNFEPAWKLFTWSALGLPVLLHIWPIRRLIAASRELTAFAADPSDDSAAAAIKAQRGYWRAAAISHALIVVWFAVVVTVIIADSNERDRLAVAAKEAAAKEAADHGSR